MASPSDTQTRRDDNKYIVLLLSLKLILLAFFILMNALSEFESRKKETVLDSVSRAFRGSIQTPRDASSLGPSLGLLPLPENLVNEIGSLFESFVPDARARRTAHATAMAVDLPAEALFRPGEHEIRPERKVLIRRLARSMMQDPGGDLKYELAFEHGAPAPGAPEADTARAVRRADSIARYLIRQAIPSSILSIGLRPGAPDMVRFVLHLRQDAP
jgi:hypothetical protein